MSQDHVSSAAGHAPLPDDDRPVRPALLRGWRRRCPNCGAGPMMRGYLKVRDTCPVCTQELHHHRADDGPAYLTILIVGHLMAPLILIIYTKLRPDPLTVSVIFSVCCVALSLWLLPRLKGALVALQWSRRMHGFAGAPEPAAAPVPAPAAATATE
ncbi:DUF983 domain-containing protein [Rhodobacter sp. SGA-6-6]|uniref:DUF983 domain-containing protein n=1 Tax=Rhodobacter sp. SGA-6-6 TaxID=2710882 RepID=UPI003211F5E2